MRLSLALASRSETRSIATAAALRSSFSGFKQMSSMQWMTRERASALEIMSILEGIQPNRSDKLLGNLEASTGAQYFCHSIASPSIASFRTDAFLSITRSETFSTIV